jgi:hypothetical protein
MLQLPLHPVEKCRQLHAVRSTQFTAKKNHYEGMQTLTSTSSEQQQPAIPEQQHPHTPHASTSAAAAPPFALTSASARTCQASTFLKN